MIELKAPYKTWNGVLITKQEALEPYNAICKKNQIELQQTGRIREEMLNSQHNCFAGLCYKGVK